MGVGHVNSNIYSPGRTDHKGVQRKDNCLPKNKNVVFNKPHWACLNGCGPTLEIRPRGLDEGGWAGDIVGRRTSTSFSSRSGIRGTTLNV